MRVMAQIASKQILVRDVDFNCDEATTVTGDSHLTITLGQIGVSYVHIQSRG